MHLTTMKIVWKKQKLIITRKVSDDTYLFYLDNYFKSQQKRQIMSMAFSSFILTIKAIATCFQNKPGNNEHQKNKEHKRGKLSTQSIFT